MFHLIANARANREGDMVLARRDGAGITIIVSAVRIVSSVKIEEQGISFRNSYVEVATAAIGSKTIAEVGEGEKEIVLILRHFYQTQVLIHGNSEATVANAEM